MYTPTTKDTANTSTVRFRTWRRVGHVTFFSSDHDSLMNCRIRLTGSFSFDYDSTVFHCPHAGDATGRQRREGSGRGGRDRNHKPRVLGAPLLPISHTPPRPRSGRLLSPPLGV